MHITDQHAERPGEGVPAARVYHAAAAPLADDGGGALIIFGGLGISSELHEIVRDTRVSSLTPRASSQVQVQAYPVGSEGGYHTQAHDLLSDVWRLDLGGPSWERLESRVWDTGVQPAKAYGASVAACSALHACGASMPLHLFGGMRRLPLFDGSGGGSGGSGAGRKASTTTSLRPSAELWAFDPRGGGQWERVLPQGEAAAWPTERAFHTALVLADTMLVYGGVREDGGTLSDLWLFSLPGKAWTLLRPSARAASELPLVARAWHTAVPSSTFATDALVFGGLDGTATSSVQEVSATPFLQGERPFTTGLLRLAPPTCERADDAPAAAAPVAPTGEAEAGDVVNGEAAVPAATAVVCVSCPAGTFTAFASPPPPPRPPPTPPQPRQP
eukprot:scaffold122763_cov48-Phaeocystis_antarctica.AAC.1